MTTQDFSQGANFATCRTSCLSFFLDFSNSKNIFNLGVRSINLHLKFKQSFFVLIEYIEWIDYDSVRSRRKRIYMKLQNVISVFPRTLGRQSTKLRRYKNNCYEISYRNWRTFRPWRANWLTRRSHRPTSSPLALRSNRIARCGYYRAALSCCGTRKSPYAIIPRANTSSSQVAAHERDREDLLLLTAEKCRAGGPLILHRLENKCTRTCLILNQWLRCYKILILAKRTRRRSLEKLLKDLETFVRCAALTSGLQRWLFR